jgi:hypothetical protein
MQVKVYEIIWGETQTTAGTIGGSVVTYSIAFSDQGVPGQTGSQGPTGATGPAGPQANINYTVVTTAQTLSNSQNIAADTSGGAFTLTLPANPSNGDAVDIFDYSETFDTNPLIIARNGEKIESQEEDLICNVEGAYFTLIYTGADRGWQILPRYGTSVGGGVIGVLDFVDLPTPGLSISQGGPVYITNSNGRMYQWSGASYVEISPFPPVELIAACSDEISPLTTGDSKVTFRTPCAFELTEVKASVNTAPVGSPLVVDINRNGISVLSTKLSIDAGETTSVTAAIPPVLIATTFASDDMISVDIDQAVANQAGTGLKVTVIGTRL